jgi:hypothetical protein
MKFKGSGEYGHRKGRHSHKDKYKDKKGIAAKYWRQRDW